MSTASIIPPDAVKPQEFHYKPVKMILWTLLFALLVAGFFFMAYLSLNPAFYDMKQSNRYMWVGETLRSFPIWARVSIWVLLGLICVLGGSIFLRRWFSGLPPLVLSAQGITGFTKGFGLARLTIPWEEVTKVQALQSNAFIYGTVMDTGGIRKPKPPLVVVHLSMIGRKFDVLIAEIASYRQRLSAPDDELAA
jgi:hypothetical protein